jgi:hypothetical protein
MILRAALEMLERPPASPVWAAALEEDSGSLFLDLQALHL